MISSTMGIEDINLDGFQVVNATLFTHYLGPAMVLFNSAISFSGSVISALNRCECINIMVNTAGKKILVRPTSSSDPEAVRWFGGGNGEPKTKRIECTYFARQIYESWSLDPEARYRSLGHLVKSGKDRKLMMLFDFSNSEIWRGGKITDRQ